MSIAILQSLPLRPSSVADEVRCFFKNHPFGGKIPAVLFSQHAPVTWMNYAREFSRAPISNFHVGAVLVDDQGNGWLGANFEIPKAPVQSTLHAEQSSVANARAQGTHRFSELWVSAAPCGHCRQFLQELPDADTLVVKIPKSDGSATAKRLIDLLPQPFRLPAKATSEPGPANSLEEALEAAAADHTGYAEAVALRFENPREELAASSIDSCAYNPSIPAIVSAINRWNLSQRRGASPSHIRWANRTNNPGQASFDGRNFSKLIATAIFPEIPFHEVR